MLVTTEKRDFFFAARTQTAYDLDQWVPAIMAAREGRARDVPPEPPVLLDFSMDSEDDAAEGSNAPAEEVPSLLKAADSSPSPLAMSVEDIAQAREREEDARGLEQMERSWEVPKKRDMFCKTLVRVVNFLNRKGNRIRNLLDLSDGRELVNLLRSLGVEVAVDPQLEVETAASRYDSAAKIQLVSACVGAMGQICPQVNSSNAPLIASGNLRALASFVWAVVFLLWCKKTRFRDATGLGAVAAFVMHSVAGYAHVRITPDLTASFCDGGFALNAILDHHFPGTVEYDLLMPSTERNVSRCFSKAHDKGVPLLLDASDFLDTASFDETSLVLYLAAFAQVVDK